MNWGNMCHYQRIKIVLKGNSKTKNGPIKVLGTNKLRSWTILLYNFQ